VDYVTEQFNARRLVPKRELQLPLSVVQQSKDKHTPPKIKDGVLYKIKPRSSFNAYLEENISLVKTNEAKPFIKGTFGYTESSILAETKEGEIVEIDSTSLEINDKFDLGVLQSSLTIVCKGFYIVEYRDVRAHGEPIKIGRKNIHENQLAWGFEPVNTIKSFSVTEDERTVVVTDHRGGISSLDIETGNVLWQKDVDTSGILTDEEIEMKNQRGTGGIADNPHIYQDVLVMGYLFSYMIGLDMATGAVKWKKKSDGSNVGRLTVDDKGRIYYLGAWVRGNPVTLYTIDCLTGESIKETIVDHNEEDLFDSAVYSDVTSTHFWGVTGPGFLYAINLKTGTIDWTYNLGNGLPHVPMFICNNRLYVQTLTEQFIFEGQGGYIPD